MSITVTSFTLSIHDRNLSFDQIGRAMDLGLDLPGAISAYRFPDGEGLELQFSCIKDVSWSMEIQRARSWVELVLAGFDPKNFADSGMTPPEDTPPGWRALAPGVKLLAPSPIDFAPRKMTLVKTPPPGSKED